MFDNVDEKDFEDFTLRTMQDLMLWKDSAWMQKDSFDFFIYHKLPRIIDEEPTIEVSCSDGRIYRVIFGQVFVDKPYIVDENRVIRYITPNEARLRDINYTSIVSVNIKTSMVETTPDGHEIENNVQFFNKVQLARIPMMVQSKKCNLSDKTADEIHALGECKHDKGGYFIIKGKERVLVTQERMNHNTVYVFEQKPNTRYLLIGEMRSMSEETGHSILVQMKICNTLEQKIVLQIPFINADIPLGIIFKAYGFSIKEIHRILKFHLGSLDHPTKRQIYKHILRDANMIETQEKAENHICQSSVHPFSKERKSQYVSQILNNELFPHLGLMSDRNQKGFFLGHMLQKLIATHIKIRSEDDRDHLANKRLETSGYLLCELFRTLYKRFIRTLDPQLAKRPDILVVMSKINIITQGIRHCFSTGNWGIPKSSYIRTGVSQVLSRLTYNSALSHLKRVLIPVGKEGKNTKIRQVNPSQIGYICPHECFDPETPVLLWDGAVKKAKDIVKGDILIDDKGKPTRVWKTVRGETEMWEICPEDVGFMSHTVTSNHILSLKIIRCKSMVYDSVKQMYTTEWFDHDKKRFQEQSFINKSNAEIFLQTIPTEDTLDISIKEYMMLNTYTRGRLKLFKTRNICWAEKPMYEHPYLVGLKMFDNASMRIPRSYLRSSQSVRFELFMGIVDARGKRIGKNGICIPKDNLKKDVMDDILLLIRSISIHCSKNTSGDIIIGRISDNIVSSFKLNPKGIGHYVGWQLEGNGRFLLSDCTVVHNTPEGQSSGIVKNMAFLTEVSSKVDTTFVRTILENTPHIFKNFDPMDTFYDFTEDEIITHRFYKIFLNGIWIGISKNTEIYTILIDYKKHRKFHPTISISVNEHEMEILIFADEGRPIRPLFDLSKFPQSFFELKNMTIDDMIEKQIVQYVDAHEMENYVVAMSIDDIRTHPNMYNFLEIHPSSISSICTGLIPFSDHTQAPRITYHASMGKQAIGLYATTHFLRADAVSHLLVTPERPLVRTHTSQISGCDAMVNGCNLIVAICMYTGFNQEDSVILNQSAIDRGLLRSFMYKTLIVEERKKSTNSTEVIELTPPELRNKSYNYTKLDKNGIIRTGFFVGSGDVIVSRVHYRQLKTGGDEKIDTSVIVKSGDEGIVDRVFSCSSPDGYRILKIKIRRQKIPEIGDKVASRNAQKGTVGMVLRCEDMPFSSAGIIPDLIINPLCIPSRMTINQLLESIAAKGAIQRGKFRYATPFTRHSTNIMDTLTDDLHACGMQRHGLERMFNGMTGEMLEMDIFIGPVYYQRLKHLVSNKIHARNHGSIQALTRQPLEGRSRDGGLRFGEMERDAISSGTPISLQCGLSVKIDDMLDGGWKVLSWDKDTNGIVGSVQTEFLDKGYRECIKITLEDGRTCTPSIRHPFLTSSNHWIRALDITPDTVLQVSMEHPLMDIHEEIKACGSWMLNVGTDIYKTNKLQDYLKTLAFMRVLGWLVANRHQKYCGFMYSKSMIDTEAMVNDLQTGFGYRCSFTVLEGEYYGIRISETSIMKKVSRLLTKMDHVPCFLFHEMCPQPIIREFLGAVFGSEGSVSIQEDESFGSICMPKSKDDNMTYLENIKILLTRCGIHNTTITSMGIQIPVDESSLFYSHIGFRYRVQKSMQLETVVSYYRFCRNVTRQHKWIQGRIKELSGAEKFRDDVIRQAVNEITIQEGICHSCSLGDINSIPSFTWYKQHIGAVSEASGDHLATINLRVVHVKHVGARRVFDIQVDKTESFLANGVVAHNCMISHGVSRFLTERLYDMSDKFTMNVCSKCGAVPDDLTTCHTCNDLQISNIKIPYACKLLFQELNAMGIKIRMFPEDPNVGTVVEK